MNVTFRLSGSCAQPRQPTSSTAPQTTSGQPPELLWPPDPQHIAHPDKTNPNVAHAKLYMHYVCSWGSRIHRLCSQKGGQWLFFSTGSKVSHKKIQYSKCTGSAAYQYIIQKGDRWQAIRRWKAIGFCVSPYLWMHQSAAVDNWIKKETWWTSSSKKLKLPAIRRPETLMGFFGSKNYLWHLHSSASRLHFN